MAVLELKEERVNVFPFSDDYDAIQDVPIATVGTVWEDPRTGEIWFLVFNEALYFGSRLKESLLCPNQMRAAGIRIEDVPVQFDSDSSHSIIIDGRLQIPLEMHGVISHINTRLPTQEEIERYREGSLQSVELTSDTPWEPYSEKFAQQEQVARGTCAVSTVHGNTSPRSRLSHEEEEKDEADAEEDDYFPSDRRPYDPMSEARCIAVASRWAQSRDVIELADEETLAERLIAAMSIVSTDISADGLDLRPDDSLLTPSENDRVIAAMSSKERGPVITKELLARRWGIGLDTAHRTLTSTTQQGIRRVLHPVERRYRTRQTHLRFPTLNTKFYTDTMFATVKSLRGNKCAQFFTNGAGYDAFYPLKKEANAGDALNEFVRTIGVPKELVSDGAKAETQGDFYKVIQEYRIKQRTTEPYSPWQNRAEGGIREIKRGIRRATHRAQSPKRLWDYCGEWVAAIRRLTAHDIPALDGRVPAEVVEGSTPDISEYAQFDWYQYVWYYDPTVSFPADPRKLARWVGVAHDVGNPVTFWVLPASCKVIARSTVWGLTDDERNDPRIQAQIAELDASILEKIGDLISDTEIDPEVAQLYPTIPGGSS
jgi:hypothetical protein